jgi:Peptidase family M23
MFISRIIILVLLFVHAFTDKPKNKASFISPVKIPLLLSANFGELRIDHFHSGVDIKTQGVTGKEVLATAPGYIYRISVSPGGFGKALYIKHPSGYSTVYGHLEKFNAEIDKYVKAQQYERKSFLVTLYPPREKFRVSQGETIALSGNSGSSGGPHLHYEIRKSEGEIPLNPLLFDFGISDNIKPVIEKLIVYPVNRNTLINNQNGKKWISVAGSNGKFTLPSDTEIEISGEAGFGIKAFDLMDDSNNKCAVYSIELRIDSNSVFKYVMDSFSFNESRYINSHIDYEIYQKEYIYIERTFVLPNDKLSVYKNLVNRGIYNFNDNHTHQAEIIVTDMNNNKSRLSFKIKAMPMMPGRASDQPDGIVMPFNRRNSFEGENVRVIIPDGALYDTINFSYKKSARTTGMLSDLHFIHNIFTPVHKSYTLSIKPDSVPAGKKSKMLLIELDDDNKKNALNSYWSEGYISAEAKSFGKFYVGMDTVPPDIQSNGVIQGANLTGRDEMRIRITDDLSGIDYYDPEIDGKWALFEYDQKNNVLIYKFDPNRIARGTNHNLSLKVADNKDNISSFNCSFTW